MAEATGTCKENEGEEELERDTTPACCPYQSSI